MKKHQWFTIALLSFATWLALYGVLLPITIIETGSFVLSSIVLTASTISIILCFYSMHKLELT